MRDVMQSKCYSTNRHQVCSLSGQLFRRQTEPSGTVTAQLQLGTHDLRQERINLVMQQTARATVDV